MTSAGSDDHKVCDRFYRPRTISGLPRDLQFDNGIKLAIDYARQSEVTSLLPVLLESASVRGDNVGSDEFVGPYAEFLTQYAFIFTARWKPGSYEKSLDRWRHRRTSSIAAFIVIGPSIFSRTIDPSLADIHVIRASDVSDSMYFELIETSIELTRELDVGYMDCIMSVSVSCESILSVLTDRLKFTVAATIPVSVHMANGIGLVDSKVLVRNIVPLDHLRQPRSSDEVEAMLAKHDLVNGVNNDIHYDQTTLPSVDILPQQYFFRNADILVTIRNMRKYEDRILFDMINSSVNVGEGIALHDLPNLAFFREVMLLEGPCVVFEDSSKGVVIGFMSICPSWLVRSSQAKCAELTLIIVKQYQSRGFGRELLQLLYAIVKYSGYTRIAFDHFTGNIRSQRLSARFMNTVGVIPRAAYLTGSGWQGQVIQYGELPTQPTVTELLAENRRTWNSNAVTQSSSKL